MFSEFRKFILRGNVVDLAVGVVIGAGFNNVIQALVKDMVTPIISIFGNSKKFSEATFSVHGSPFYYGDFINVLVSFLVIATVVFFFVVQPINKLTELAMRGKMPDDDMKKCPHCIGKIPKNATKCMFCTSKLEKQP